jgi:outer membrane protein OmpA-like peptidoglycan-associated protein
VRSKARLVIAGALLWELAACSSVPDAINPISWYRNLTDVSDNDELGQGQNEQNLAAGGNQPYPNLGTVPATPNTALSSVDRDKLVNSLVADRNNAKYSNEDLHAGAPNVASSLSAPGIAALPAPDAAPASSPAPSQAPGASAPTASAPAQPSPPSAPAAAAPPPSAPPSAQAQRRAPARGSEAPPAESPLTSPTINNVPQGEAVTDAPPAPRIPPPTRVALIPPAAAPRLTPPGTQVSAPAAAPSASRHAAISYRVADVGFAAGSALLGDKLHDTIAQIVKLHGDNGGTIRIIGHGEAGGANAAVAGLNLALDRAQAVAIALTDSGVPAQDIAVEAAPVAARGGKDVPRAEVYLEN